MRLKLILPTGAPDAMPIPTDCPRPACGCPHVTPHQPVRKPLRDTQLDATIWRYRCVRRGHTFRVYPPGISRAQTTTWLRALAVMLTSWDSATERPAWRWPPSGTP